ncbi:hypothetical protein OCU04_004225 [Sclerotinia nivalis]|uniref:Uncharacterized protein n=1 Tax=Sclerotinia nivalis TaxID=352851 RepID=A0A9X0DNA8_9HELO|nr:hypothetical protein OCU04_004225 [Sclerotinia nivalis]
MPPSSLEKTATSPNIPPLSPKHAEEARETFKEYMERMYGEQAVLDHPDLVSLFGPLNPPRSSVFMKPDQTLPSSEMLELSFRLLTEEVLQFADIKYPLYEKLFFGEASLVPSSLQQPQKNGLLSAMQALGKARSAPERNEPIDVHQRLRSHLNYACNSPHNCAGKPPKCIIYSLQPSGIQRPPEDSPDYLPHHTTTSSTYRVDFVHPCREYTQLFEFLQTIKQIHRLDYHNGLLLVPENRPPEYYSKVNRLIQDDSYGTIATYMACCKHNSQLWTKMGDESMAEKQYRFNCRICNHSYVSPDGRVCRDCTTQKVLQKRNCKKEYGMPLMSYMRNCCSDGLTRDLFRNHFWKEDEDGVPQEFVEENKMNNLGMQCSNDPNAVWIQTD